MNVEAIGMTILGLGLPTAAAIIKFFPARERRKADQPFDASFLDRNYVRLDVFKATIAPLESSLNALSAKIDRLLEMQMKRA